MELIIALVNLATAHVELLASLLSLLAAVVALLPETSWYRETKSRRR